MHAKCLRSLPLVRDYFRSYRAKKRSVGAGPRVTAQQAGMVSGCRTTKHTQCGRQGGSPAGLEPISTCQRLCVRGMTEMAWQDRQLGLSEARWCLPAYLQLQPPLLRPLMHSLD